jgi:DNA-binding response OmpR family regulator
VAYQILVVSPDDLGRQQLEHMLEQAGYGVAAAATFAEGKRLLAVAKPDILITDERLGDFNGLHLILRARFNNPEMGAILTTGEHDREVEREASSLNAQYVVQPKDSSEWLRVLESQIVHHTTVVN